MKILEAEKVLQLFYDNKGKLEINDKAKKTILKARKTLYSTYSEDPKAFIENHMRIVHFKTNDLTPFVLNSSQNKVLDVYMNHNWLAVPKARQLGITTLTNALALHHAIFSNNAFVLCMAVKADNAAENLSRIRTMFNNMPAWLKALLYEWNDKEYTNSKTQWSFKSLVHHTKSTLEVASAASEDSTRGKQVTFAHWTETAFSEVANEVFTAMSPSLKRRPDSRLIMESTGNGATGFYYEACMGKRKGFEVIFLPWYEDAEYKKEGTLTSTDRSLLVNIVGTEVDHLSDEQLIWYRDTSSEMGISKCQQEYPNTIEQVFLSTNKSFFSTETILKIQPEKALYYLNYKDNFLTRDTFGPCTVWEAPHADYEYLISADTSEGVIDPSSINVINPHGDEVAYWTGKYEVNELSRLLVALAKHYNNAWVAIESNGIGASVINTLRMQHFYQYLSST